MKTCSKCSKPRQGISSLCKQHRNERENERRRAQRAGAIDPPIVVPRGYPGPGALDSGKAIELMIDRDAFLNRPVPDARPTAPEPNPLPTGLARVLFIPDTHRPYHDKRAWQVMLKAARVFQPDKIVVLGDFADFYAVSHFTKDPRRKNDLQWEADDVNEGLDELDALDATHKIYIAGNHEDRLEKYLSLAAPALIGVTSVPELFRLNERGWYYTPYKRSTRLGKLRLTHDTGSAGINAHRSSMDAFQASVIIGHTHRMEMSFKGNADGHPTVGAMFGWLGDFDQVDYMQAVQARRSWVHGFGIGYEEPNGVIHLQPVPIINEACVVAGQLIR
jgi:predicted phosphodiesterase